MHELMYDSKNNQVMLREFSAGGIVINDQNQVLVINNAAMRDPSKSYWGFPKGHIEKGETSEQAAVREIKEETGIDVEIIQKLGDSKYVFTKNNEKIFKVVVYFLMKYVSGELKIQQNELLDAKWVSTKEALELLNFPKDKEFLKKSIDTLTM